MKYIITTILLFVNICYAFAQLGSPFIKNYDPEKINISPQVWDIKQDERGVMYFGCNEKLVSFNGKNWQAYQISDKRAVLSMDFDSNGVLYIGSENEFGYMQANDLGDLEYVSLSKELDDEYSRFTDVWRTVATTDGIYFWSLEALFRYNPDPEKSPKECLKIWEYETEFNDMMTLNDSLYILTDAGMISLQNDSLKPIYGKEFSEKFTTWITLPYPDGKVLCANEFLGLFIYNPLAKTDADRIVTSPIFDTLKIAETNEFIKDANVYTGIALSNGNYALGSLSNGIIIINPQGEIIDRINDKDQLQSNIIQKLYQDKQGELWVALGYGISRIEISSPFCFWDKKDGLEGPIANVCSHNGQTYCGTDLGIFCLENDKFSCLPSLSGKDIQSFILENIKLPDGKYHLLASTSVGVIEIIDKKTINIIDFTPEFFFQSSVDSSKVYISDQYELYFIQYKDGEWLTSDILLETDNTTGTIYEENKNFLWVISQEDEKPYKIDIANDYEMLSPDFSGLPQDISFSQILTIENKMIFTTNYGNYKYENDHFQKDTALLDGCLNDLKLVEIEKIAQNTYYLRLDNGISDEIMGIISKESDEYQIDTTSFKRLKYLDEFYMNKSKNLWLTSPQKLYFAHKNQKEYDIPIKTLIEKVTINEDSVIFSGTFYKTLNNKHITCLEQPENFIPNIAYKDNDLTFYFTLTSYDEADLNLYSYSLSRNGKPRTWSHWTKTNYKEYTNLFEGEYTFRVKAKNIFDTESTVCEYSFVIETPWHRTYWAYLFYIISGIAVVYLLIKFNTKRLQKENEKLEDTVKERTAEILQQKEEIETIAENLQTANDEIMSRNKEIKEKNKQITDSILYAKRIQTAAMPNPEQIDKILPSHFIFFKPRDIVSGDYYWTREIGDSIIVMAADCTGHGIPGAFMSMLGISLYNEIARRTEIQNVALSLDLMRNELKKTLRQKGDNLISKDGIDLSVISINKKKRELQFAGANNPIFVIQNNELKTYKADRMPVGVHLVERPFTNHTIPINAGDLIYMFSDGYSDQFGGDDNFKFSRKRLRELIDANKSKSMQEQYEIIKSTHEKWSENNDQIDDILVIGIKIVEEMFDN